MMRAVWRWGGCPRAHRCHALRRFVCVAVAWELLSVWSTARVWAISASPEGDDASDRIVGRNAHGNPIAGNDLNAEAAHPAAQLGQHFVAGVHLHAIEAAAVHGNHGALDINEIVLTQIRSPFKRSSIAYARAAPLKGRPTHGPPGPI